MIEDKIIIRWIFYPPFPVSEIRGGRFLKVEGSQFPPR